MCKVTTALDGLHRPRLLVETAAIATAGYERRRDLRRMLRAAIPRTARAALEVLLPIEAALETRRRGAERGYCHARHVDILCALMAEARAFRAA